MEAMALIEIDGLPKFTYYKWWIFPWFSMAMLVIYVAFNPPLLNLHQGPQYSAVFSAVFLRPHGATRRRHNFPPNGGRRSAARALRCSVWGAGTSAEKRSNRWGFLKIWGAKSDILWMVAKSESPVENGGKHPRWCRISSIHSISHVLIVKNEFISWGCLKWKFRGSLRKQNSLMLFGLGHWSNFG